MAPYARSGRFNDDRTTTVTFFLWRPGKKVRRPAKMAKFDGEGAGLAATDGYPPGEERRMRRRTTQPRRQHGMRAGPFPVQRVWKGLSGGCRSKGHETHLSASSGSRTQWADDSTATDWYTHSVNSRCTDLSTLEHHRPGLA